MVSGSRCLPCTAAPPPAPRLGRQAKGQKRENPRPPHPSAARPSRAQTSAVLTARRPRAHDRRRQATRCRGPRPGAARAASPDPQEQKHRKSQRRGGQPRGGPHPLLVRFRRCRCRVRRNLKVSPENPEAGRSVPATLRRARDCAVPGQAWSRASVWPMLTWPPP